MAEINSSLTFPLETKQGYIIISPFGSNLIRSYPVQLLIEAMAQIQRHAPSNSFLLCGAPSDSEKLHELLGQAHLAGICNARVELPASFIDFCSLVASAKGIVTVETSTAHLATALNKPTVVLMGGGHFGRFGPWQRSSLQVWLTHETSCCGCNWVCIHPESICISRIEPSTITAALLERMDLDI